MPQPVDPVSIVAVMWSSYVPTFLAAAETDPSLTLRIFSQKALETDVDQIDAFCDQAATARVILLYRTNDGFWSEVDARLETLVRPDQKVVATSFDPTQWGQGPGANPAAGARVHAYLAAGGLENTRRLLSYLASLGGAGATVEDPEPLPWQGLLHPPDPQVYPSVAAYRDAHPARGQATVGLLFSRHTLTNTDGALEAALITALEARGLDVLPVFSDGVPDAAAGSLGPLGAAARYFCDPDGRPVIQALMNLHFFFLGRQPEADVAETGVAAQTVAFFTKLDVPVFKPVVSYSKSAAEWADDPQGLIGEATFGIAMPEFEGNIEPIIMACSRKVEDSSSGATYEVREPIAERIERIAARIARWVRLANKPTTERKVVFVLHKNECAGLEAGIGGAGGLDSGQSIVAVMRRMAAAGYRVGPIPESGEALLQTILARKAIAEFRWTTVDEIIAKGGHLALLDTETYNGWYARLPEAARRAQTAAWGEPPGQAMNGVPPAMVYEGKIVITGLDFGNVAVMMQPKRGCAGARCDGQVCKILHDPDVPPPHQYIATYMYMDRVFGADVIVHVGTHGNLEWMPGKGAGLSAACWPDIAVGDLPHLYIYNADNPAEGVVAKRRSYAVLVDHLQTTMTTADTYGGLQDLEDLLGEYRRCDQDPARAHQLEHLIRQAVAENNLQNAVDRRQPADFSALVTACHEILSALRNSQTRIGLHVFGDRPEKEKLAEQINTILRFDSAAPLNTRRVVFGLWGESIEHALEAPADLAADGQTCGERLYAADRLAVDLIGRLLDGQSPATVLAEVMQTPPAAASIERFEHFAALVKEIAGRFSRSDEIGALLGAFSGGHVPAGPSGYLSRGRYDILPTGRNFYNVDPTRIPTRAAHRVGVRLAEALLARFMKEEGRHPETVGMVWMASDIMRADGEQIGQILHLLGVRPRWRANGQVDGFEIIPAEELGRPRIDVSIRVSGITRDCFPDQVRYVDQVVQAVAMLDEPAEVNLLRAHLLEQAAAENAGPEETDVFRRLSYRIFCAQPGVYKAGVNLAVAASAWKTDQDLADVYLFWNGFAYGGGADEASYGAPAHSELMANLARIEVTFDKHISDEGDFLNCCGYYGSYGGMTAAARVAAGGRQPKTYYGDTRDPANVAVTDFAEELERVVRAKLLHPKYIEGLKAHGYKGAGDLNKRIGRVYGYGATTGEVEDWVFDEIADTFVLDAEMRRWFEQVNPWALEEIGRRLLEAEGRGIWKADPERLEQLREAYLEAEARLEETVDDVTGDFQGGAVDVLTADDVAAWKEAMAPLRQVKAMPGKNERNETTG